MRLANIPLFPNSISGKELGSLKFRALAQGTVRSDVEKIESTETYARQKTKIPTLRQESEVPRASVSLWTFTSEIFSIRAPKKRGA
ncbi:hypothetical protein HR08_09790 [Porphyromonas gulae]|uniref:Uncharacterized protein n=1 Tax=Porphyromonas gulae TaxID=111105 RepID=A0A0A2EYQ8_9PORP|nr:hypothetical protein HR08_09790 [Porphyromonas gulae]